MTTRTATDASAEGREAIANAALQLFLAQGYEETTVQQIARVAGSSRATVFRYFGSKEDILFDRYDGELEQLRLAVRKQKGSEGQRARVVLMEFAGRLQADKAYRLTIDIIAGNPRLRARALLTLHGWAGVLAEELAANRSGDNVELSSRVLAHSGVAALHEAICVWRVAEPETSLVELATEALYVALGGRRRTSPSPSPP